MKTDQSEIAKLRREIAEEMEAMQNGLTGFAAGVGRHEFIQARMHGISNQQEQLAQRIGKDDAATIVCEMYISIVQPLKRKG